MSDEIIDNETGEVVDEPVEARMEETTSLPARRIEAPSREVLMPLDAGQVVEGMKAYQRLLVDLLDEGDWQIYTEGKERKQFPKKSAWRKIARAFNLSVQIEHVSVERDENGKPLRAECIARAIAPNGQVQDADGYCAITEFKGRRADDVKLENTLRATATTRAKNRAIADLVGMGEVSAEEVTEATPASGPPYGPPQSDDEQTRARDALIYMLDKGPAKKVWETLRKRWGYMPAIFAQTAIAIAEARASWEPEVTDADLDREAEKMQAKAEEATDQQQLETEKRGTGER